MLAQHNCLLVCLLASFLVLTANEQTSKHHATLIAAPFSEAGIASPPRHQSAVFWRPSSSDVHAKFLSVRWSGRGILSFPCGFAGVKMMGGPGGMRSRIFSARDLTVTI